MLYPKKYGKDGIDISKLMSSEHMEIWQKRKVAIFLNASYEYVEQMPYDEFVMAKYLSEIEGLCHTQDGNEVLKSNIRYMQTEPELEKLRERYGKGGK